jgi:hypothetical protein
MYYEGCSHEISTKNNKCYNFVCESHPQTLYAPNFGGRPVGVQLQEQEISYFMWNHLNKSDKSQNPTILYIILH